MGNNPFLEMPLLGFGHHVRKKKTQEKGIVEERKKKKEGSEINF